MRIRCPHAVSSDAGRIAGLMIAKEELSNQNQSHLQSCDAHVETCVVFRTIRPIRFPSYVVQVSHEGGSNRGQLRTRRAASHQHEASAGNIVEYRPILRAERQANQRHEPSPCSRTSWNLSTPHVHRIVPRCYGTCMRHHKLHFEDRIRSVDAKLTTYLVRSLARLARVF